MLYLRKSTIARTSYFLLILSFSAAVQANPVFNAAADFSLNSNPNGVWTYGYSTTLGGTFILDANTGTTISGNPNFSYWDANIVFTGTPGVYKNTSATNQQAGGLNLEPGQLALHPGPHGEVSIVRWTSPDAGNLSLNAIFTGRDNINGTTTDVHVFLNGSSLFDSLVNGFGLGSGASFATSVAVLPGGHH